MKPIKTMGDMHPSLLDHPHMAWLAEKPYPWPPPDSPTVQPPGLFTMVGNLARASVEHAADGFRKTSPDVQEARKVICFACPLHEADTDRCRPCGCFLSVKRTWASEACPEGQWSKEP